MIFEGIFLIVSILIIWFNTDAFVEYARLLKLPVVKVKEYTVAKEKDCTLSYHMYLLLHHNNFFTRLITCPICTSMWLSIIIGVIIDLPFIDYPILFIFSLYLYELYNKLTGYENK